MERLGGFDWRGCFFGCVAGCVATVVLGFLSGLSDPARPVVAQSANAIQIDRRWERTPNGYAPPTMSGPVIVPALHPAVIAAEILLLSLLALAAFPSRARWAKSSRDTLRVDPGGESTVGDTWKRPGKSAKMMVGSSSIPRSGR
jgi:hypothetical protein